MAKRPVTSRPRGRLFVGCDAQRWVQVSGAQGLNVSNAPMVLGWPGMREKAARPGEGAGTWGARGLKVGKVVQFCYSIMSYRLIYLNKKMTCQGSQSPGRDEHGEVQAALYSHPAHKKRSPGRPLCRLLVRCGSGQGIGPEVLQGSVSLVSQSIRAMHRAGSWRGSAAPGGRGRSLSLPRAPGGAGVGHGWG